MLSQLEFTSLMDKIVVASLPTEAVAYESCKTDLIAATYAGQDLRTSKGEAGEFEFGESIVLGLKVFTLAWATFKALREIYAEIRPGKGETPDQIASLWSTRLVEEGLDRSTAEKIATGFAAEVQNLIRRRI